MKLIVPLVSRIAHWTSERWAIWSRRAASATSSTVSRSRSRLQQGLTQDDYSLTGAVLVVGTIAVLQVGVSWLTFASRA